MQFEVINIDPEIMGGTPVFNGTRVPIQNLFDFLEEGESIADFIYAFPTVTKEQVTEVLKFSKDELFKALHAA